MRQALGLSDLRSPGACWPGRLFVSAGSHPRPSHRRCLSGGAESACLWALVPGGSLGPWAALNSHYLGLHTCLVKPMRFIQPEAPMGSDQRIKFWLRGFHLSGVAAHACFHPDSDSSGALRRPAPRRAPAQPSFRFFLKRSRTYTPHRERRKPHG